VSPTTGALLAATVLFWRAVQPGAPAAGGTVVTVRPRRTPGVPFAVPSDAAISALQRGTAFASYLPLRPAEALDVLTWRDGALAAAPAPSVRPFAADNADDVLAQLSRTLMAHQVGTPNADRSVLMHGDTQYCSDISWAALLATGSRAVVLPRGELKTLPALLDALRAQPRTPYVVVAEMLSMVLYGEAYYALFTVLELDQLPSNVLLLATSRHESMLRPGEVNTSDEKLHALFEETLAVIA
jgi:hypothetical protein